MDRRLFVTGVGALLVAACTSSEISPSDPSGTGTPVYLISAQRADDVMRQAMSKIFTRLPIMSVEVPHKGYTVSMLSLIHI